MPTTPVDAGVSRYRAEAHPARAALFDELAGGQSPDVLLITCADSRIDPALITQTDPGSLFVCRNAGNIVPSASDRPDAMLASIEYAVAVLGVSHAVVVGHSACGAMAALIDPPTAGALPEVEKWLPLAGVSPADGEELGDLVARNARQQLEHLRLLAAVASAEEAGSLTLHAWTYDIGSGEVLDVTDAGDVKPVGG